MDAALQPDPTLEGFLGGHVPVLEDVHAETLYAAGYAYFEQGEHARAADVFRLLALARPHAPRSWIALAATHEAVGDLERALSLYGIATQAREATRCDLATAFLHIARTEHLLGEDDEARDDLERHVQFAQDVELDEATLEGARVLGLVLSRGARR